MEASTTTAAAIIAGGRARRFDGQDKSRLVVEGRTIIVRQVEVLQRVAANVFAIAPDPARYADLGLTTHPDVIPGAGAIGGIDAALTVSAADAVLVVACDMPFLDAGLLRRLVALSDGHDGAWVRSDRGVEPLVACYRRSAARRVRQCILDGRLRATGLAGVLDMAELGPTELTGFGPPERLLANVNTPADYARVQYGGS